MSTKMDLYNDHLKRNHTEQGVTSNVCKLSFYIMGMLFSLILLIQKSEVNFVWISPKELAVSFIMILLFFFCHRHHPWQSTGSVESLNLRDKD